MYHFIVHLYLCYTVSSLFSDRRRGDSKYRLLTFDWGPKVFVFVSYLRGFGNGNWDDATQILELFDMCQMKTFQLNIQLSCNISNYHQSVFLLFTFMPNSRRLFSIINRLSCKWLSLAATIAYHLLVSHLLNARTRRYWTKFNARNTIMVNYRTSMY